MIHSLSRSRVETVADADNQTRQAGEIFTCGCAAPNQVVQHAVHRTLKSCVAHDMKDYGAWASANAVALV